MFFIVFWIEKKLDTNLSRFIGELMKLGEDNNPHDGFDKFVNMGGIDYQILSRAVSEEGK